MGQWLAEVNVTAFATNLVVVLAAIAAAAVGSFTAIKSIKKAFVDTFKEDDAKTKTDTRVASAMIMETTTLLMWSESNRDVVEQLKEVRFEMRRLADAIKESNHGRQ